MPVVLNKHYKHGRLQDLLEMDGFLVGNWSEHVLMTGGWNPKI